MEPHRANIVFPPGLTAQIDEIAGPRGRNAYVVEVVQAAVRKERLLKFLSDPTPVWKDEDHPELAAMGTVAWVRQMRTGKSDRQKAIEQKLAEPE